MVRQLVEINIKSPPPMVETDASETAVGAVLTQEEGENERPVAYASHKLLPAEKRYATIERECLAIQWTVDHFRYYLMGREFKLARQFSPVPPGLRHPRPGGEGIPLGCDVELVMPPTVSPAALSRVVTVCGLRPKRAL
ncbi:hypothetical protein Y1Q_0021585 [Alligator mississippiensis]|uniref:Reverse transcriptase/retrotransposon-derived protein RNase H-like domain-containing protein n=1 Tax=Alligator mississippiensis TaxID=8496 RepID=A0A151PA80_ALLMI|nr:hypothetical protein Y1Q_0021585 [Alligator mississippiensis]